MAGTVGSFAISNKVRDANSLAFVDGVPIFERFFLGDEFTIRGYHRAVSARSLRSTRSSLRETLCLPRTHQARPFPRDCRRSWL